MWRILDSGPVRASLFRRVLNACSKCHSDGMYLRRAVSCATVHGQFLSITGGPEIPRNERKNYLSLCTEEISRKQGALVGGPSVLQFGQILEPFVGRSRSGWAYF